MKAAGPLHKSNVDGVKLNISSKSTVEKEFDRMISIPDATGIMIQPMVKGTEVFIGAKTEGKFGPMILCGLGGIFVEVLRDISHALAPVGKEEAGAMIRKLKGYPIIQGARGKEGIDEQKFAETIARISALAEAAPEIVEMDLNPLLGNKKRLTAVDARIKIDRSPGQNRGTIHSTH
jgi:acetyltransferase